MAANLLRTWKEKLWPTGASSSAPIVDPGPARYSDSEIASLKQQRARANAVAREEIAQHGKQLNPRIAAARAAGSKV